MKYLLLGILLINRKSRLDLIKNLGGQILTSLANYIV